jgi:NADH-quinone oxidoreductase subunit N
VAIIQKDIKRLLAYSSISHAGYMLIGILSMTQRGYASAIYYALAYLVMNFACFMVILKIADDGHNLQIKELAGLHRRSPLLAMTLMLGLFGLAGIPPTLGFTGKFLVFAAAMEKGYFMLVVIGMINATISLYYYLIVIKAAYLLEPAEEPPAVRVDMWSRALSIAGDRDGLHRHLSHNPIAGSRPESARRGGGANGHERGNRSPALKSPTPFAKGTGFSQC